MLDVPTTRVAYVKVTPTISNWIQPIAIETSSRCGSDGLRSSCKCGQALIMNKTKFGESKQNQKET